MELMPGLIKLKIIIENISFYYLSATIMRHVFQHTYISCVIFMKF